MASGYDTFGEFEVGCPKCENILRLSSEMYEGIEYIDSVYEDGKTSEDKYDFQCVVCNTDLSLSIKVSKK